MSTPSEIIISQESEVEERKLKTKDQNPKTISEESLTDAGFYWREKAGVKVLVCKVLEDAGFANGFSTRIGGVSDFPENSLNLAGFDEDSETNIFENRKRFLSIFDGKFQLSTVWQVHGDSVKIVETNEDIENTEEKFDALASDIENLLVGVKTADCVPILLADTKTKAFAAIHAGWRGTVQSIAVKTIEKMRENFGTNPQDLICALGPAATCKSYEIGQDVIDEFARNFSDYEDYFQQTRDRHALVDLHLANRRQLLKSGVSEAKIFTAPFCTMENNDLFFSYRLEKKKFGKTGRLLSVIGRKS